jgi:hypothetical protein
MVVRRMRLARAHRSVPNRCIALRHARVKKRSHRVRQGSAGCRSNQDNHVPWRLRRSPQNGVGRGRFSGGLAENDGHRNTLDSSRLPRLLRQRRHACDHCAGQQRHGCSDDHGRDLSAEYPFSRADLGPSFPNYLPRRASVVRLFHVDVLIPAGGRVPPAATG